MLVGRFVTVVLNGTTIIVGKGFRDHRMRSRFEPGRTGPDLPPGRSWEDLLPEAHLEAGDSSARKPPARHRELHGFEWLGSYHVFVDEGSK